MTRPKNEDEIPGLFRYDAGDMDLGGKLDTETQTERAKCPEKYPKYAMPTGIMMLDFPKLTERIRHVDIYEADSPEQMMNLEVLWIARQMVEMRSLKKWVIPLQEITDSGLAELRHQRKLAEETKEQPRATRLTRLGTRGVEGEARE